MIINQLISILFQKIIKECKNPQVRHKVRQLRDRITQLKNQVCYRSWCVQTDQPKDIQIVRSVDSAIIESAEARITLLRWREDISEYELNVHHPFPLGIHKFLRSTRQPPLALNQQISIRNFTREDHGVARVKKNRKQKFLLPDKPTREDFIRVARAKDGRSGLQQYREWLKFLPKQKIPKVLFTSQEDNRLIQLHQKYGENWEKICQIFQDRSFEELYFQYHNRIFSSETEPQRKRRWSTHESIKLLVLREHFGSRKWADIAKKLKTKSELQVRQRFVNILDPAICQDKLSDELSNKLMQAAHREKYKWNSIKLLKQFKGKTDNALWRTFRNIMIKKTQAIIQSEVSQSKLASKLIKIKRKKQKQGKKPLLNQSEDLYEQIFQEAQ